MTTIIFFSTTIKFPCKRDAKISETSDQENNIDVKGDGNMTKSEIYDLWCVRGDWQNVTEFETMECSDLNLRNTG